jgi:capsular polysaccharide biosynthesis protein
MQSMLRAASLEMLRWLPISSEILGPPKGFYRNTEDWLASSSKAAAASQFRHVFAPSGGPRRQPITIDGVIPWPFHAYYGGMSSSDPAAWVLEMPEGRIFGEGAVITPDDCLLADVSRELIIGGDQSKHSVRKRRRFPPVRRIPGRVAVVAVSSVFNSYYHWFFDVLPRFLLLEHSEESYGGFDSIDAFVVNRITAPFQSETLAKFGIPPNKIIECREPELHIKADRLLVPSLFVEVPSQWASRMLRDRFANSPNANQQRLKIYISRADATARRVLNEDAVMERIAPLGFRKVTLSGMSVAEQCELFSCADVVVAPHGAGLTNLLFCREGTRIVEIFPPTYINPGYWVLANHLGLEYYCSIAEGPSPPPPPVDANVDEWFWSFVDDDKGFRVDLESLLGLLDSALNICHAE